MTAQERRRLEAKRFRKLSNRDRMVMSYAEMAVAKNILISVFGEHLGALGIEDRRRAHRVLEDIQNLTEAFAEMTRQS